MRLIENAIQEELVLLDCEAEDLAGILRQAIAFLAGRGRVLAGRDGDVLSALLQREQEVSTAIGHAVAVPHAYLDAVPTPTIVFVRLQQPLNLGAPDGIPTRFVFLLLGPQGHAEQHLDSLTAIARLMSDSVFRYEAAEAVRHEDLLAAVREFISRTAPPEADVPMAEPVELQWSGRPGYGILTDARRRLACYASDFRDGLHAKTIPATILLFFACLAPAITFGGIMGAKTGGQIGAVEMLVATAACGVVYALIGGQPLMILGGIGPLLVFTEILYEVTGPEHFLPAYACVGLWTALFLAIFAVTEASCLMKYFTRFTDDIFAGLMSLIFVVEAIQALFILFRRSFRDGEVSHDTALLSLVLALGTFQIAMALSSIRRSRYLNADYRQFLSDFGPTIALASMAVVAVLGREYIRLEELNAPQSLRPTFPPDAALTPRAWLINPLDAPGWMRFAAAGPALLAAVLIYLAQNITSRLVNAPENKLQKGQAFHLDMLIVGVMVGVCSLFGLPWLVAATVRSLAHVRSLAVTEDRLTRDGDTQEEVIRVRENRVSGLLIHLLIGCSLLLLPWLKQVPMAVLYGLFLYMGIVSIRGNQFFERLSLLFMDKNLYPQTHYLRRAPVSIIHRFTLIQFAALACLWLMNLMPWAAIRICFPLMIGLLVPLRFRLGRWFQPEHLAVLDTREQPSEESSDWAV